MLFEHKIFLLDAITVHTIQDTHGLGEQSDMKRLNSIKYENGNNETNYFIRVIDDYNMACQTRYILYGVVWCCVC